MTVPIELVNHTLSKISLACKTSRGRLADSGPGHNYIHHIYDQCRTSVRCQSITEVILRHIHMTPWTIRCHMYHMYLTTYYTFKHFTMSDYPSLENTGSTQTLTGPHHVGGQTEFAPRNPVDTELQDTPKLHPAPPTTLLL